MSGLLEPALGYAALGWAVIPVRADKRPAIRNWQADGSKDPAVIRRWFASRGIAPNLGIVCGLSGLIVVDVDPRNGGEETFARLVEQLGALPPTVTADTGGGGVHYVFRATAADLVGKLGPGVDFLHGPRQFVVEPSIHPSGKPYRWRAGFGPHDLDLSQLPAAWLVHGCRSTLSPASSPGTDLSNLVVRRAAAYVAAMPPAISGQGGHDATFEVAIALVCGFDLSIGDAFDILADHYNPRCVPPWSDEELFHKLEDADREIDGSRGYLLDAEYHEPVDPDHGAESAESRTRGRETPRPQTVSPEPEPRTESRPRTEVLPTLVVTADQAGVVNQAQAALLGRGGIYVRGRVLVTTVRDHGSHDFLERPEGISIIARIGRERLREMCGASARWVKVRRSRDGVVHARTMVPLWVPATLAERGEWPFPPLDGISDAPVLREDGTIHDVPGYDGATRTIYEPNGAIYSPISAEPTRADAARALEELLEPFVDFPFLEACDRAATAALILSLVGRPAIRGCVPIFLVRSPTPGTGKGMLVDAATTIATGRVSSKMAPTSNDDEMRKRLLAIAIEAPAIVTIDNVEDALGSPALAMALTASEIHDRLLGSTEMMRVPLRAIFAATGNNVALRGDTGRRVVPIDLDPRVEHPEDRHGFAHRDLLSYVRTERPRLYVAALTVLRGYVVAGRPEHGLPPKGSYESWDALIRSSIIWAGGADPLESAARIREQGDEDLERLRALLRAWRGEFGDRAVAIADAVERAKNGGSLFDALASYCGGDSLDNKLLGYALRKVRGRPTAGLMLDKEEGHGATSLWHVRVPTVGVGRGASTNASHRRGGDGGDGGDGIDEKGGTP